MSNIREFDEDDLYEIMDGSFEGATIVDEQRWNDDWYNHTEYTFVFDGVQYSFERKSHTSPNVSDSEFVRYATPTDPQPVTINEDEEAEYIQNYLLHNQRGIISTDDIKLIIEGQFEYMKSIGLA